MLCLESDELRLSNCLFLLILLLDLARNRNLLTVAWRKESKERLSSIKRVDAASILQILQSQALAWISSRSWRKRVLKLVEMAYREPDKVWTETLCVIVLTQDCIVSWVYQFDLDNDSLDSQVLQFYNQRKRGFGWTGVPTRLLACLRCLRSCFLEVNFC